MSVIGRLWRIARAYAGVHPEHIEDELKEWEEEVAKRIRKEKPEGSRTQKPVRKAADSIADAFRALEVEVGAPYEVCKKAYRRLAQKYHPDKWQDDTEKKEIAGRLFTLIGEAYERIKDFYGEP